MAERKTAVEMYADGHREVYHHHVTDTGGYVWTHGDDKKSRRACSMCTDGTLTSVRELVKERER